MLGRLLNASLSTVVETVCAQTQRPMSIELDNDLRFGAIEAGADPMVFIPLVNMNDPKERTIINIF